LNNNSKMFSNILSNQMGSIIISVILGLGLASMFRKVCKERDCIVMQGPSPMKIKDKTFEWHDKCYKYKKVKSNCQKNPNNLIPQQD